MRPGLPAAATTRWARGRSLACFAGSGPAYGPLRRKAQVDSVRCMRPSVNTCSSPGRSCVTRLRAEHSSSPGWREAGSSVGNPIGGAGAPAADRESGRRRETRPYSGHAQLGLPPVVRDGVRVTGSSPLATRAYARSKTFGDEDDCFRDYTSVVRLIQPGHGIVQPTRKGWHNRQGLAWLRGCAELAY